MSTNTLAEELNMDDIPTSAATVENVLRKHIASLREDHACFVKVRYAIFPLSLSSYLAYMIFSTPYRVIEDVLSARQKQGI